ncbi:MAG: hypothetical protein DRP62_07095 [Planctomycetota bacterium]|nr:MAG: hypothetical protein DRP62_07095 [Planctomycetota bacterium]
MNIQKEQIMAIFYTILGCILGAISLYLTSFVLMFGLVFILYLLTIILIERETIIRKPVEVVKALLSDMFLTYVLVWLTAYILFSNILV